MDKQYTDDPTTIAPCKTRGGVVSPDLVNNVPSRIVTRDEATARGFTHFWESRACRHGHQAARWVKSLDQCTDCWRITKGKPPIYPKATNQTFYKPRKEQANSTVPAVVAAAPQPDPTDKKFLVKYAEHRDLDAAAEAAGTTPALVQARRSYDPLLDAAMSGLEESLLIPQAIPTAGPFEWTKEKHARLIEVYVDTGLAQAGRDSIKVTPSEFFRELERNAEFAERFEIARPLAEQALQEKAYQLSLQGNDRLLIAVLKATQPEKYADRMKVDVNNLSRLTDDQLNAQLRHLLLAARNRDVIDAEFKTVVRASKQIDSGPNSAGARKISSGSERDRGRHAIGRANGTSDADRNPDGASPDSDASDDNEDLL